MRHLLALTATALAAGGGVAQPTLSGGVVFRTDGTGAFTSEFWNTRGNDSAFNLYLTAANTGVAGPILNPGNGAATSLNQQLPLGSSQFALFGGPGGNSSHFGVNLFSDGDTTNPGISAFAPQNTSPTPPYPAFQANSSPNTLTLAITGTPGAGTPTYTDGTYNVTLTDFYWSTTSAFALDRVSAFDSTPGGGLDFVGSFTVLVTPVPEPACGLAVVGLVGGLAAARRWLACSPAGG